MAEDNPPDSGDAEEPRPAAEIDECEIPPADVTSDEQDPSWDPFEDVTSGFQPSIFRTMAEDGMPSGPLGGGASDIPALSPESFVCMGIFDEFVRRNDYRDIVLRIPKADVARAPDGRWRIRWGRAVALFLRGLSAEEIRAVEQRHSDYPAADNRSYEIFSRELVSRIESEDLSTVPRDQDWLDVEPIRPPCKHYVRQFGQFAANPEHQYLYRVCSARRDTAGAFMSLDAQGMWACDIRSPRDVVTEKRMDDFDEKKIEEGKNRVYLPIIGTSPEKYETRSAQNG